jgi:HEAT repeat protein
MRLGSTFPKGTEKTRAALEKVAKDESPVVRQCAAYVLGKLGQTTSDN